MIQPHSFNDLKTFIHQSGTIHRDFSAHFPIGMSQGVGLCRNLKLLLCPAKEGAAGAGQNNLLNLCGAMRAHQTLKNGRMLRVHRDNLCTIFGGLRHDQFTGADQGFLIGKANALSGTNGGQCGFQAYHAHHGGDDAIHLWECGRFHQAFLSPCDSCRQIGDSNLQLRCGLRISHNSQFRNKFPALLRHALHAGGCGQCSDPDTFKVSYNVEALSANGAG